MMMLVMRIRIIVMWITHPSLLVSPAEERAKPNLDSVKPSVSRIGAVEESSLLEITIARAIAIAMMTLVKMMMMARGDVCESNLGNSW